jgi:carbon-monoxide dehydrogenase medium subunit
MKPASFSYHRARSLEEALGLLAEHGDEARLLAGGQSLVPMMNMRLAQPAHVVDLNDVGELAFIRETADGVEVGAMARQADVERSALVRRVCPLLAAAAASIGHYAIRQRGTIGGSLAHADPAAQLPLAAVTLEARIDVAGPRGRRALPASEFFVALMTTALDPGEIVVGARFPRAAPAEGHGFELFSRRYGDFALFAAAATVSLDAAGRLASFRLAAGGATPVPVVLHSILAAAGGAAGALAKPGVLADSRWCEAVAAEAASLIDPDDNPRVPAEFRRDLAPVLLRRSLAAAVARATGEEAPRAPPRRASASAADAGATDAAGADAGGAEAGAPDASGAGAGSARPGAADPGAAGSGGQRP